MSQAHKCFGASGLSLLLGSWALDLKMLVPFLFGAKVLNCTNIKIKRRR